MRDLRSVSDHLCAHQHGQGQGAAEQEAEHGQSEEQACARKMRHQATTDWHGDGADDESPGGDNKRGTFGQPLGGEIEKQIHRAEAKAGNMAEAVQTAL